MNTAANLYRITYLVPSRVYVRFGTGGGTYVNMAQVAR